MIRKHNDLYSLVIQSQNGDILSDCCRTIVDRLVCSDIDCKNGIKTTTDMAMGNTAQINVERTAVLRQYYGKSHDDNHDDENVETIMRSTYGVGCGSGSVGTDPHNYVTRDMSIEMLTMGKYLMEMQRCNKKLLNLQDVNLDLEYKHCTILLYYSDQKN